MSMKLCKSHASQYAVPVGSDIVLLSTLSIIHSQVGALFTNFTSPSSNFQKHPQMLVIK